MATEEKLSTRRAVIRGAALTTAAAALAAVPAIAGTAQAPADPLVAMFHDWQRARAAYLAVSRVAHDDDTIAPAWG